MDKTVDHFGDLKVTLLEASLEKSILLVANSLGFLRLLLELCECVRARQTTSWSLVPQHMLAAKQSFSTNNTKANKTGTQVPTPPTSAISVLNVLGSSRDSFGSKHGDDAGK